MTLRERVLEDFAGDLEYHPKRGATYLALGVAALLVWIYLPAESRAAVVPLVFGLGSIPLCLKGVFFLRRSSEGLGLTQRELDQLAAPSNRRSLPPASTLVAQVVQDFGVGPLLLAPVLHTLRNINDTWEAPALPVFVSGVLLVGIGWIIRRMTSSAVATDGTSR